VLCACGSGDASNEPVSPGSTGTASAGREASDTCEGYSLGDGCVNERNLAQCMRAAAQCPGEVQVMESCPLQFSCPGAAGASGESCLGRTLDDACMDESALAQCQAVATQCPGEEQVLETCPLQFRCP